MVATRTHKQRIARLTPLAELLALIDREVVPVAPRRVPVPDAVGGTSADHVIANAARPAQATALRDGFALRAEDTVDAGSYAPAILSAVPVEIDTGAALPDIADAVAPLDSVRLGAVAEVLLSLSPGDGVLPAGADAAPGEVIVPLGHYLRPADVAVLQALAVTDVTIRKPTVLILKARRGPDAVIDAAFGWLARLVSACADVTTADPANVETALSAATADAVLVVGGTGSGSRDGSVIALARAGRVAIHGVGLNPGDCAGFGFVGQCPVLLIPGRLDAVIAVWLTIGRPLLARLCGRSADDAAAPATLSRKIVSAIGCVDVVPVRRQGDTGTPLASGYWPLAAIASADGYIMVPAESEGFAAGTMVAVKEWR